ncbi:hypothetical protein BDV38DRAFT_293566 [Aspergillus pseudotamarii]|uniref:Secreted protein n=1 Tax=Aspergillus pseudotamarii TaxID=132259 RepID=A0A5N6SQN6_ASPPS|nr:uncharacterized protein BDV38DRAFT_293566 [Aspergillus pseudotamarii]KAE8137002.1 hypothetical protein BDV38DRAFT_293566 [Aspergillus pseudotamarii]
MVRLEPLLLLHAVGVLAAVYHDSSGPSSSLGTFQNPSVRCRPRFRYWLPDAGVDKGIVSTNIKDSGERGAGGIEFVPFYNYGGEAGDPPPQADWVTNGFGTPAFRDVFRAALQAHKEAGLLMDFALGPNQGQGVPASSDDPGLQWDLVPFSVPVGSNETFQGPLPGWGTGELIAVVLAEVLSQTNISLPEIDSPFLTAQSGYLSLVLEHESLTDITDQVSEDGQLSISLPTDRDGVGHRIFAYYQKRTLHKNLHFTNNATTTIWDNGSFAVDHYSSRGAQTVIDFWESHILIDGVKELLMEVGNYDSGAGYINDYRSVLEDCYREYLQTITDWARHELHLEFSAQVSYNLPMDMEVNIPVVDAPECESLQFGDSVDAYRQFSGPALLAGKRIISNEMGATMAAYGYPFRNLLFSVGRAIVGGVNQLVLHGQSYTGDYYETTWPGYTAFSYSTSELYSNKQPSWDHGLSDVLNFFARVQYTQRQGIPRVDVAIYNKVSATDAAAFPSMYQADDLVNEGWSWAYLSPDNFALPAATVRNGTLGPDGPRFKALVITSNSTMTLSGLHKIQEYAILGLPIIMSGGLPGIFPSANESVSATIEAGLAHLSTSPNVHLVRTGGVADKLSALGLSPHIQVQTDGRWLTTWREDSSSGIDYALIFCDSNTSSGYITITGSAKDKVPFYLNAWTGAMSPVFTYNVTDHALTLPVSLQGNQTMIIAFSPRGLNKSGEPTVHAIETPPSVIGATFDQSNGWVAHVTNQGSEPTPERIHLSSDRYVELPQHQRTASAFNLTNWHLVAEHWETPTNLSDANTIARKHNTTHELPALVSWSEIPILRNASGLGYYTTTFQWPPTTHAGIDGAAEGAYIVFPSILHSIQLSINGHRVPPLDYTDAKADISRYLKGGTNEVRAVVPTTMWNYIRSILPEIRDQGHLPGLLVEGLPVPGISENGLVEEVTVIPYSKLLIR